MLGVLGRIEHGALANTPFPFSFFDTGEYWGEHVCKTAGVDCNVIDVYDARDYTLIPRSGPAGDLQVERVNTHKGSNIYDSAT